jgi:hypothetical protein
MTAEDSARSHGLPAQAKAAGAAFLVSVAAVWLVWTQTAEGGWVWVWASVVVTSSGLVLGLWLRRTRRSAVARAIVLGVLAAGALELAAAALVSMVPSGERVLRNEGLSVRMRLSVSVGYPHLGRATPH